jgi:hypothetical protein
VLEIRSLSTADCGSPPIEKPCSITRDYANSVFLQLICFVVCLVPNKIRRCVVSKKNRFSRKSVATKYTDIR